MSNGESEIDVVKEARELLASGSLLLPLRVGHWHMSLTDGGWHIKNASDRIVMTVAFVPVEIETGKPAIDGNAPARHTAALLNSVPALCDEVEQLRSLNQTQEQSIRHLQGQLKTADDLHRVTVEARIKAENEAVALRDACQKFVHWYAKDSSEFKVEQLYEGEMAGMTKEQQVEAFNIEHPVGSPVTVQMDGGGVLDTTVKAPAKVLGGHTPVVWLEGISGCYALHRVFGYCHGSKAPNLF